MFQVINPSGVFLNPARVFQSILAVEFVLTTFDLDLFLIFHCSLQFSGKIDATQDEISRVLLAEDVTSSSSLLHQHQELRKSVLELSMQTLAKGQVLLDKLREASTHADINNSHATKAACYSVERILEALHHRRQQLDEQWKERKKVLEQCIKRCKIDEEIQKVNDPFATLLHVNKYNNNNFIYPAKMNQLVLKKKPCWY